MMRARSFLAIALTAMTAASLAGAAGAQATPAGHALAGPAAAIRVDQVGYLPAGPKVAFVMLDHRVHTVGFRIEDSHGSVLHGSSSRNLGAWNARYAAVYRIDFSQLRHVGTYRIALEGAARAHSPWFRIASAATLYRGLVRNGVHYFESERDGADVIPSILHRRPANLTDRHATVYAAPHYNSDDALTDRTLTPIGGPVDVSGGWFDAGGGYEKFGYTAAYTDGLMSIAARQLAGTDPRLSDEAEFGLRWLEKLWNPVQKVAYVQVGIGSGGEFIAGDYDHWFLPQQEDRLDVQPGDADYYVKYRPVFAAAAPGQLIDPDLAGRYAAAFALGAQLEARTDPADARHLLYLARTVYAQARTHGVGSILTAYPHDFYPGTQWKSDMLWGGTEITLADEALRVPSTHTRVDLAEAARWARAYIAQGHPAGSDTLNLYDDGAVAEADLLRAQRGLAGRPLLPTRVLLGDLAAQLRVGEQDSVRDPFGLGTPLGASDVTPHAFGLFITEALYQQGGGGSQFRAFAQQQLDYTLGANPWGTSLVVGAGHTFPHCLQSEIANLAGSLDGTGGIQLGAVGDGPSAPDNFEGLGTVDGMRACTAGNYQPFDNAQAAYEDNVVAWPSVEPADDYTMNSLLAFVLASHR